MHVLNPSRSDEPLQPQHQNPDDAVYHELNLYFLVQEIWQDEKNNTKKITTAGCWKRSNEIDLPLYQQEKNDYLQNQDESSTIFCSGENE